MFQVEIDSGSGFCFGVTTAIKKAEEELAAGKTLYCLGDIVHNGMECERLRQLGLITINHDELAQLHGVKVLLRAHGEPPETYELARRNNIEIIDATCPVVLQLQRRIKTQYEASGANIVIFGKPGHAEVLGLVGQTQGKAIVIEKFEDVKRLDFSRDIYLYSQTTKSLDEFHRIIEYIQQHIHPGAHFQSFDTICRSVANRMPNISQFATRHDLILFVCGRKSSNGKVLFDECRRVNPNSHLIEGPEEIQNDWLQDIETIGICGATSTPKWLMEQCRDAITRCMAFLLLALCWLMPASGQRAQMDKLSPMLRQLVRSTSVANVHQAPQATAAPAEVCAFVKATDSVALAEHGCKQLARFGNLYIANVPIAQLAAMTVDDRVLRIEANRSNQLFMDSVVIQLNATDAYTGQGLPQPFTGRGVVVGVMDVGFDLTHPNFYSRDTTEYRIKAFWDQLSTDTVGSPFPVGRDYRTRAELLGYAHSRDGLTQTHGTHTLGSAAGSGYDSPYRGMAPEADICLVANAVSDDLIYIDSTDVYKYTFATDALGFKYIFDYAEAHGQPCVISFSEGSTQDFWGYDQLYYEMLDSLVGPGRILLAAAGNQGRKKSWFRKPAGQSAMGTFVQNSSPMMLTFKAERDFALRIVAYGAGHTDTLLIDTRAVLQAEDSTLTDTLETPQQRLLVATEAYPSCYEPTECCYDLTLQAETGLLGTAVPLSVEVVGQDADVECYRVNGTFVTNSLNEQLAAGECTHNVHSPASAPSVICVGGTIYRQGIVNYQGEWKAYEKGGGGERGTYSSVGPTYDGRVKPDVMAPGANIISSYSSYYLESQPDASDIGWDVAHFDFNGRTYAWNCNSGTSMACPAAAGAIALWLQANPKLTTTDVLGVLSRTCRRPDASLAYPNNYVGYGEIDVYAGLLDVLGLSRIAEVSKQPTTVRIAAADGQLHVSLPSAAPSALRLRLFAIGGQCLLDVSVPSGQTTYTLNLPALPSGYYAVQVSGPQSYAGSAIVAL